MSSKYIKDIAKICHDTNRSFCESIEDYSQLPWEICEKWQRESAINGVKFQIDNPDLPASASHENWLKVKEAEGWVYGPVKDPQLKQHPCMVPYNELPVAQRRKDYLFKAVVHAMTCELE